MAIHICNRNGDFTYRFDQTALTSVTNNRKNMEYGNILVNIDPFLIHSELELRTSKTLRTLDLTGKNIKYFLIPASASASTSINRFLGRHSFLQYRTSEYQYHALRNYSCMRSSSKSVWDTHEGTKRIPIDPLLFSDELKLLM